jgi:hypothetical protein
VIKRKKDTWRFIKDFEVFAHWDESKHYLVFEKDGGTVTLMKYVDGSITYHRKNLKLWDLKEIVICDVYEYIWVNRKAINQALKVTV